MWQYLPGVTNYSEKESHRKQQSRKNLMPSGKLCANGLCMSPQIRYCIVRTARLS